MLKARGLAGEAPSPTFAIVQPYAPPEVDLAIAHVDLYRIEDADELIELGLDEYLYDGALLIEWPDRLGGTAWPQALALMISGGGAARALTASVPPALEARWPLRCFRPPLRPPFSTRMAGATPRVRPLTHMRSLHDISGSPMARPKSL